MNPAIPGAAQRIQEEPQEKLKQMRPREGRDLVPDDRAGCLSAGIRCPTESQAFDALGIRWISQCSLRARRSSNSARARSVPCRRSTKGETTARRKSAHPRAKRWKRLSGSGVLSRNSQSWQTEQDAKEKPKIGVQDKILVRLHSVKRHGKQEKSGVPEDDECQWKPGRTAQFLYDLPCREHDRYAHDKPE